MTSRGVSYILKYTIVILVMAMSFVAHGQKDAVVLKGNVVCLPCEELGVTPEIKFYFNNNFVLSHEVNGKFNLVLPDTFADFPEIYMEINASKDGRIITNSYTIPLVYYDSIHTHEFQLELINYSEESTVDLLPAEVVKDSICCFPSSFFFKDGLMEIMLAPNHYTELRYGEFTYSGGYSIGMQGNVFMNFGGSCPKMFNEKLKKTCFNSRSRGTIEKKKMVLHTPCGDRKLKLVK